MMKYFFAMAILVSMGFICPPKQQNPLIINDAISLVIPVKYETNEELSRVLFSANDKMVYVAVVTTASGRYPFAVSVYHDKERVKIAKAFEETVHFKSPGTGGYKLLDWGTYVKDNKTLRYKITEIRFDTAKTNSIMYYFMKGDESTDLYEIKITCNPKSREELKTLLEKIALSLKFL
jgi:hypothetical protein